MISKNKFAKQIISCCACALFLTAQAQHHGYFYKPTIADAEAFKNNDKDAPRTLNCWATPMLVMPMEEQPLVPTEARIGNEVSFNIPDKPECNIKGVVYCGKNGVSGVVVSDGTEVTVTDSFGRYYLKSTKENQNVFISIPSGFTVKSNGIWPKFYSSLKKAATETEQANFELTSYSNNDYTVIGLADIHIANVRQTLRQYQDNFLPDINRTISTYQHAGKDVYILALGDQSHDLYWYDKDGIDLEGSKEYLNKIGCTAFFTTMGNHDNDPYIPDDFSAAKRYRSTFGPTHYSFNIAGTHYIMLDNIVYINNGGKQGTLGDRSYSQEISVDQLEWLIKDLQTVDKTTPVVIGMHAMMWKTAILPSGSQTSSLRENLANFTDFKNCLDGYNVTILSGHNHVNSSNRSGNIREYNVGSAAGRLWESGQTHMGGNHLCGDGSCGGYLVMEKSGKDFTTYYKSVGYDKQYQFRTYDLNKCHITAAKYCPASTDAIIKSSIDAKFLAGYDTERSDNYVRINVFGFNNNWKIKVTENGSTLTVKRINGYDPLWTISVPCMYLQNRSTPSSSKMPVQTSHLFEVKASSPTSTLEIEVTDEWGNVYKQTMTRPKELTVDMQ